jgi:hypothetical protein
MVVHIKNFFIQCFVKIVNTQHTLWSRQSRCRSRVALGFQILYSSTWETLIATKQINLAA